MLFNHPFSIQAFFNTTYVMTFAVPVERLTYLLPDRLVLDTYNDRWGFIAVAMVDARHMRPKGWPKPLGRRFSLIGYRLLVRYQNMRGKNLRGLYILKSETNKWLMRTAGNQLTRYNYSMTDISWSFAGDHRWIKSNQSALLVNYHLDDEATIPIDSPFLDWKTARRYAGPMPFSFSYDEERDQMLIVEGVRSEWRPVPVTVDKFEIPFLKQLNVEEPVLASAFEITKVPYYWKRGVVESWG